LAELDDHVVDGPPPGMKASVVVAPSTVADVAKVLAVAASHGVAVTPFGSGSTLGGANTEIALSTWNLGGVVDYQPDDLTVVVGAGTRVSDLEELLAGRGHTAVLPEHAGERTIGGVIASGASGYRRLKYGPTRDRVLEVELATGYGEVVRGGGRLVKNVTGYDVPRLVTGSLGSLGIISSVCLKLWPQPPFRRTVMVADAAGAIDSLYKPVAVLGTQAGSLVYLEGHEATVTKQTEQLAGDTATGFVWPDLDAAPIGVSVRVPARCLAEGIEVIGTLEASWFVAQHGVGIIDVGLSELDVTAIGRVRGWAEEVGGTVIVDAPGLTAQQRWGTPPSTLPIQRRMKTLFDPAGVCNPGVLPGGL
jgi:glycolate oxidase FAD binding subunit